MRTEMDSLKGIHPGKIIGRDLKKRNLSQRSFANAIGEHGQTLNAVITGRRKLTTDMAVKIEQMFGYDEGFLLTLQAFYDINQYKNRQKSASVHGAPKIRHVLFWDTDFEKMDWGLYKDAVIKRVMERGNEEEKDEITKFYGMKRSELNI